MHSTTRPDYPTPSRKHTASGYDVCRAGHRLVLGLSIIGACFVTAAILTGWL